MWALGAPARTFHGLMRSDSVRCKGGLLGDDEIDRCILVVVAAVSRACTGMQVWQTLASRCPSPVQCCCVYKLLCTETSHRPCPSSLLLLACVESGGGLPSTAVELLDDIKCVRALPRALVSCERAPSSLLLCTSRGCHSMTVNVKRLAWFFPQVWACDISRSQSWSTA